VETNSPKSETSRAIRASLARSLEEHLESLKTLLDTQLELVQRTGTLICRTLKAGNKILICGNGGSAADAQHIAAELVGRYELQRRAWPAIALTTDTSALTAISNDFGYEEVFARQVRALACKNDLLIAISTSGGSPNVIRAVETAKEMECKTIALGGHDGGRLASLCDQALIIGSDRTARVQETHITIGHLWCEMVDAMGG
jgi:D-sedoheptulose 7-phosphate isomerase